MPRERTINVMEKSSMSTVSEKGFNTVASGQRAMVATTMRMRISSAVRPQAEPSMSSELPPDSTSLRPHCLKNNNYTLSKQGYVKGNQLHQLLQNIQSKETAIS